MTKSKTRRYLAKLKEDEFLLVTAQPMTVYSENCAYLKATIKGTYVINVKPDEKGCNLFLDDFELPVRGTIFVNMITGDNTRIPTTFTTNSSFPTTDATATTFSTNWNNFGLPTVLIIGLLSTIIGTAVSMYLFLHTREAEVSEANSVRREYEENPPMMELMPLNSRPILRRITWQHHEPVDEDSSSG